MEQSQTMLMTVGELIDEALSQRGTKINFQLLQTVLHILAKQLRILQRRVRIQKSSIGSDESYTSINVKELKLVARIPKTSKDVQSTKSTKGLRLSTRMAENISAENIAKPSKTLNNVEVQREKQLRVIHQRIDSYEEPDKEPAPMKSLPSIEKENILIVERVPSLQSRITKSAPQIYDANEKLSIVTQEEFDELQNEVRQLTMSLRGSIPGLEFLDNAQLMLNLKKGANLTDAIAALQLAARLQAAEEMIQTLSDLLTEIVKSVPGVEAQTIAAGLAKGKDAMKAGTAMSSKPKQPHEKGTKTGKVSGNFGSEIQSKAEDTSGGLSSNTLDFIVEDNLRDAVIKCRDEYTKKCDNLTKQIADVTHKAIITANKLDEKVSKELEANERLEIAETLVSTFGDRVTKLDTNFSCRLTDFQERLTQLQFDLEIGLEKMMESLANRTGDPVAVAELNNKLTLLQMEFDLISINQKELHQLELNLCSDLEAVQEKLHILNEVKSDREEVLDSLKDKVGIGALNGLVPLEQFKCIQQYLEKKIQDSYNRFNSQELVWQKAIDAIYSNLEKRANADKVNELENYVHKEFKELNDKFQLLADIVGMPHAVAVSRILFRDTNCISCSTPANISPMDDDHLSKLEAFSRKRPPTIGAEATNQVCSKANVDREKCYPGQLMPKGHFCRRYCGGSHTLIQKAVAESLTISNFRNAPHADNKEHIKINKSCACNAPMPAADMKKDTTIPFDGHSAKTPDIISTFD